MRLPILLLLCVLLPSVLAIGISPPSGQLDFIPGKTYSFTVTLSNYNNFPIGVDVRTEGLLGPGIRVQQPIKIAALSSTMVPVTVTIPDAMPRPGYDTSLLYFAESFTDDVAGMFAARTEVGMQLTLWQPYPGHYAEITASAPSIGQGNDTLLTVRISNLGTDPIEQGTATVRVLSPDQELKDVFTYTMLDVPGNSNKEMKDRIPSHTYAPGRYTLQSKLEYSDNVSESTSSFIVGTQDVDIDALEGPIYLDKTINRVYIHVESLWNLPLDNVYATFQLGANTATTPSVTMQPFQKAILTGYWETDKTVEQGNVPAQVTVYFPGGNKTGLLDIQVYNETPAPVGAVVQEPSIVLSASDLIFMVLAVLIVIAIVIFAFERHLKHTPGPPQQL